MRKISFILLIFFVFSASSQTLPIGYPVLEDYVRRAQLLGKFDSSVSLSLRPLNLSVLKDSTLIPNHYFGKVLKNDASQKSKIRILPIQFNTEFNSHHPYGWNNGAMLRSRGLQTLLSGGIYGKIGVFSVQFKPEFVFVQNEDFKGFPDEYDNSIWARRYGLTWNRIDLPQKFGVSTITRLLPGQSNVRLNYGSFSFGISTENIWWGPGRNHSLIMTNNASGFTHLTLNTIRPIQTAIGTFEGQLIAAKLENSGFLPPLPLRGEQGNWIRPKKNEWRYLNGLVLVYHPKWINGLFLGTTRVIQNYNDSTNLKNDYLPVFSNFFRQNDPNQFTDGSRDQLISFFMRWFWEEARSEIYFELGRSDASWNLRDFLMSPEHSAAYTLGFSKIIELPESNKLLEILFETTHLELSKTGILRSEPTWYVNGRLTQGYTQKGEIIGAGIGPGSNIQYFSISLVDEMNKVGLQLERLVNDNDFYSRTFDVANSKRNWVDLSIGVNYHRIWDNLLLEGKIQFIGSKNYQWEAKEENGILKGRNVTNLHVSTRLSYLLN